MKMAAANKPTTAAILTVGEAVIPETVPLATMATAMEVVVADVAVAAAVEDEAVVVAAAVSEVMVAVAEVTVVSATIKNVA